MLKYGQSSVTLRSKLSTQWFSRHTGILGTQGGILDRIARMERTVNAYCSNDDQWSHSVGAHIEV